MKTVLIVVLLAAAGWFLYGRLKTGPAAPAPAPAEKPSAPVRAVESLQADAVKAHEAADLANEKIRQDQQALQEAEGR